MWGSEAVTSDPYLNPEAAGSQDHHPWTPAKTEEQDEGSSWTPAKDEEEEEEEDTNWEWGGSSWEDWEPGVKREVPEGWPSGLPLPPPPPPPSAALPSSTSNANAHGRTHHHPSRVQQAASKGSSFWGTRKGKSKGYHGYYAKNSRGEDIYINSKGEELPTLDLYFYEFCVKRC